MMCIARWIAACWVALGASLALADPGGVAFSAPAAQIDRNLPGTFVGGSGSVKPAHGLRSTLKNPNLSNSNATPPVVRDFDPLGGE